MKRTLIIEKVINNRLFIILTLFSYLALIFYISSLPSTALHLEFQYEDKFKHFIAYFVMGVLILRYAIFIIKFKYFKNAVKFTIIFGLLYGLSDEIHQGFVGYFDTGIFGGIRDASFADWVADALGIISACYAYKKWIYKTNK